MECENSTGTLILSCARPIPKTIDVRSWCRQRELELSKGAVEAPSKNAANPLDRLITAAEELTETFRKLAQALKPPPEKSPPEQPPSEQPPPEPTTEQSPPEPTTEQSPPEETSAATKSTQEPARDKKRKRPFCGHHRRSHDCQKCNPRAFCVHKKRRRDCNMCKRATNTLVLPHNQTCAPLPTTNILVLPHNQTCAPLPTTNIFPMHTPSALETPVSSTNRKVLRQQL